MTSLADETAYQARTSALAFRYERIVTTNQVGIHDRQQNWSVALLQRF